MEISAWHIWIIAAIIFFILEIGVPSFYMACIAIGCIAAGISSALDLGIKAQLISLSAGILVAFFGARPFMIKYLYRKSRNVKTNVDALIDKVGRVTVTINNAENKGRVIVEGDDWRAEAKNDEIIKEGSKIQVVNINSTTLIVKSIK
jgi:membrane protein implicated in regulation of membrane protease activity